MRARWCAVCLVCQPHGPVVTSPATSSPAFTPVMTYILDSLFILTFHAQQVRERHREADRIACNKSEEVELK